MSDGPNIGQAGVLDGLEARLSRLTPGHARVWGTLAPGEMLRHLIDALQMALGERSVRMLDNILTRSVIKYGALHTSFPWPKGLPTMPEADPKKRGSRPGDFDADRQLVMALMRRLVEPGARYGKHPAFGELTRHEWLVWAYRHADHHFRQFAI